MRRATEAELADAARPRLARHAVRPGRRAARCGPRCSRSAADEHVLLLVRAPHRRRRLVDGPARPRPRHRLRGPRWRARRPLGRRCRCSTPTTPLWQRELLGDEDDPDSLVAGSSPTGARRWPGCPSELQLPADRPRPAVAGHRGGDRRASGSTPLHRRLRRLARRARRQPVHGAAGGARRPADPARRGHRHPARHRRRRAAPTRPLDDLVGFFVNTLVLRTDTSRRPDLPRAAGPGPGDGPGRLRPPGRAVRAAGGGAQPGPVAGPPPAVPGDARLPEHRGPPAATCRA